MGQYLPIVVLTALAIVFGVLSLVASKLLAPKRPNTAKDAPYECGIVPSRESPERFPVSFYIVAMLFIMFDIEIIFLYPYAVAREALGLFGFVAMLAFSAIIFVTFVYELARGAMEWGPTKKDLTVADVVATPPVMTGIKLVGLDGRREPVTSQVGAA
jgi:NADH-quinone oxidoreductase subunit A